MKPETKRNVSLSKKRILTVNVGRVYSYPSVDILYEPVNFGVSYYLPAGLRKLGSVVKKSNKSLSVLGKTAKRRGGTIKRMSSLVYGLDSRPASRKGKKYIFPRNGLIAGSTPQVEIKIPEEELGDGTKRNKILPTGGKTPTIDYYSDTPNRKIISRSQWGDLELKKKKTLSFLIKEGSNLKIGMGSAVNVRLAGYDYKPPHFSADTRKVELKKLNIKKQNRRGLGIWKHLPLKSSHTSTITSPLDWGGRSLNSYSMGEGELTNGGLGQDRLINSKKERVGKVHLGRLGQKNINFPSKKHN